MIGILLQVLGVIMVYSGKLVAFGFLYSIGLVGLISSYLR